MQAETIFKRDKYRTRSERLAFINKASSFWLNAVIATIITIFCIVADTYFLYAKWYTVMSETASYVWIASLVCAIALDGPLAYYGIVLKNYHMGFETKQRERIMRYTAIIVFLLTFVVSFYFSLVTKDMVFEMDNQGGFEDTVEQEEMLAEGELAVPEETHEGITVAAVFNGMLPLLTSITSFMVTYYTHSPIKDKRLKYEKERIGLQNNLMDVEQTIAEADPEHFDRLIEREEKKFQKENELLQKQNVYLKELARVILARQMGTPEENDKIAAQGKALFIEDYDN